MRLVRSVTWRRGRPADYESMGAADYTNTDAVAHWVYARGDGGQSIVLGDGNDTVDLGRSYSTFYDWSPRTAKDAANDSVGRPSLAMGAA